MRIERLENKIIVKPTTPSKELKNDLKDDERSHQRKKFQDYLKDKKRG